MNYYMKVKKAQIPPTEIPNLIFRKTIQESFIAGHTNPASFMRDFLDVDPYEGQEDFLLKWQSTVEAILDAGNRVGKSFIAGGALLWKSIYRHYSPHYQGKRSKYAPYVAMATSLTQGQAELAFNYALQFSESARFRPFVEGTVKNPFPELRLRTRLEDGSESRATVTARSLQNRGVNLLGLSISFLLVDETAFIPHFKDIEDTVLRLRLADQAGSLLKISSPNGRNHFFKMWNDWWHNNQQPDSRYLSYRLTTYDNPWVSRDYIEEQRKRMRPELFQQNVMAEFVSISDFFGQEAIAKLYEGVEGAVPAAPINGHSYVMGVDLGFRRDSTVIIVLDITDEATAKVVYVKELANLSQPIVEQAILQAYNIYQPVKSAIDATGVGLTFTEQLVKEHDLQNVNQFIFSKPSKLDTMTRLQTAVFGEELKIPFNDATRPLVDQMSFYQLDDNKLTQDYVIAIALANVAREEALTRTKFNNKIDPTLRFIPIRSGLAPSHLISKSDDFDELAGITFDIDAHGNLIVR